MKKLITLALIIGTTTLTNAQSNLVFNQALIVEINPSTEQIIPEGKVWKVESFSNYDGENILVNDSEWAIGDPIDFRNMPIWFPAGTILKSAGAGSQKDYLSVLEFNVVAISSSGGGSGGSGTTSTYDEDFYSGGGQDAGDDYTSSESITDIDGNTYETVNIGNQTWTTSNLNVSKYRDGTPIPHIINFDEWRTASTGAYTYVAQTDNGYGKVYNYWAIIGKNDTDPNTPLKKLAPEGFHIPTEFEWNQLANIYGGVQSAGYYLKSEEGWATDLNGNNESGLNLKPGGYVQGYDIASGWTSAWSHTNINGTYYQKVRYGTKTINNSGNTFKSVMVYAADNSFNIETGNLIYNIDLYTVCTGGCNTGVYIRLVKD